MVEGVAQLWLSPCGVRSVSNEGRAGAQKGRRRTEEDGGRQVYEREKRKGGGLLERRRRV